MATAQTSPNDLTRQQLDELDALLQRMLSLPSSPAEPISAPQIATLQAPAPIPTPTPAPVMSLTAFAPPLPPPLPAPTPAPMSLNPRRSEPIPTPAAFANPAPVSAPVQELPRPAVFTPLPAPAPAPVVRKSPEPPPVLRPESPPQPVPAPAPAPPPVVKREAPPPVASKPEPVHVPLPPAPTPAEGEPVPLLLAPLVMFNRLVNGTLGLFGFPGRVLRSGFVKTLFGLVGLGLLLYTGLKVAQLHGWITLPVELPWPR